jgi:hypothetical protein
MIDPNRVGDPRGGAAVLAAAFVYFLAGCALLVATGASLASMHAFAAFIVLAVVAASNQLVPVLVGARPCAPAMVIGASIPLVVGFGILIAGFAGATGLFAPAGAVLAVGALGWVAWMLARVTGGKLEPETRAVFAISLLGLAAAAILGAMMAFSLSGTTTPDFLHFAPAHASLAIIAFASVLVVAISRRLVPMFALSHADDSRLQCGTPWLALVVGFGAAAALLATASQALLLRGALILALAVLAVAAFGHLRTLRARMRRKIDISLRYAATAWSFAFLAAGLALTATWWPPAAPAAVACAVLGWLSLSIVGYAYKISGFLAWQFAKQRTPTASLPPLAGAVPEIPARLALAMLAVGTLAGAATLTIEPRIQTIAFTTYALGGGLAVVTLLQAPLRYLKGAAVCPTTIPPPKSSTSIPAGSIHPNH